MKAMILAAGRGERMGELTRATPKPLLKVGGRYLIEHALESIWVEGIRDVVINTAYLGELISSVLGDGSRYGLNIVYSHEPERLETGGGIFNALPLLGAAPFLVMSSDIITHYPLSQLPAEPDGLAHLVMVPNPAYHPEGDYGLNNGRLDEETQPLLTYGNIGVFRPELFTDCQPGHFRLNQVLQPAIRARQITGERYDGFWFNLGTVADIEAFEERAREDSNLRPLASETNTLSN